MLNLSKLVGEPHSKQVGKLFLPSTNILVDSSGNKEGSLQLYFLPEN